MNWVILGPSARAVEPFITFHGSLWSLRMFSCFFSVSSVFNKTISKQAHQNQLYGTWNSFFWPVPSAPSWQRSNNVRRWSTWDDMWWGHLKQAVFILVHVFGPFSLRISRFFLKIPFYPTRGLPIHPCRPKQEKLQTVRWHPPWRHKSAKKGRLDKKNSEAVLMGKKYGGEKHETYIPRVHHVSMIQFDEIGPSCHQPPLGIAVGGFHGGSGGEQLLVQSYNLMSVTWRINDSCVLFAFSYSVFMFIFP